MNDKVEPKLRSEFEDASKRANKLPNQPPEVLLKMYGLYKQARKGDVTGKRPGRINVRGRYKYDAWASRKGMSKEEAMQAYIELIIKLESK